jgi:type I restriction enzyme S subunit
MCIVDRIFSAIPIASTGFAVMACYPGVVNSYLFLYLQSPQFDQYANDGDNAKGVAYPAINDEKLYKALIPVPPKNEQNRIVEFISTIQPSLNRYNSSQRKIDDLNRGIKPMLRKSILQEAIQGKLVPQEPKEKPATFLLEQIREEKQKLLREGLLKKKDIVDSVIFKGEDNKYYEKVDGKTLEISEEIPFDIPESWAWVRLGSVVTNEAGLAYSKDCLTDRSQPLIRVLRGGNIEEGRWSIKDDDVIISKKYVKESLLLKHGTFITPAVTSIERMAKTALIQEDHHDIVVGGFVLMIKPVIIDNALLQYLNLFFQTTYYKKYCISITNKSGQAFYNLSRQKLMQCLVPIPPEKEQYRIADKYSQLTL